MGVSIILNNFGHFLFHEIYWHWKLSNARWYWIYASTILVRLNVTILICLFILNVHCISKIISSCSMILKFVVISFNIFYFKWNKMKILEEVCICPIQIFVIYKRGRENITILISIKLIIEIIMASYSNTTNNGIILCSHLYGLLSYSLFPDFVVILSYSIWLHKFNFADDIIYMF